jgi:predicted flap endonuclease-1-like 5' DNA nuclease
MLSWYNSHANAQICVAAQSNGDFRRFCRMTTEMTGQGETTRAGGAVSFNTKLRSIPGLNPELVAKLAEIGIVDSGALLARASQPDARDEFTNSTGIDTVQLLQTLYVVDLERVDGISWATANLLTAAGVTTVPDLAFRVPEDLLPQLQRANGELGLVKRLPTAKALKGWIDHARELPQVIYFRGNGEVY